MPQRSHVPKSSLCYNLFYDSLRISPSTAHDSGAALCTRSRAMLSLRLLGAPAIREDDREVYLPSQKAQALLFYLAAEHQRSVARSQLITLSWEESSAREGRNSLSTVLTRLRQALPVFPLRAEGDTLAWQKTPDVRVDLHEFQAATLTSPKDEANEARIRRLEAAITLYSGTF